METNLENPKPLSAAKSSTAVQRAPLWEIKEIFPASGMRLEKLPLRETSPEGLMTPRQLGPTSLISASLHNLWISFSISYPSPPTSLNPAETMIIPLTPLVMQSFTAWSASLGGRITMARSMGSGIAATPW